MDLTRKEKFVIIYENSIILVSKNEKGGSSHILWEHRTMKNFVRVTCLLLACLFCLLAVVACTGDKKKNKKNTDVNIKVDGNGVRWAEDEWGVWREYDNLPDDLNYDDTVSILYWTGSKTVRPEFAQSEEVDDAILSSIYKRNQAVQNRLGVELNLIPEPGDAGARDTFVARVQRAKDSGTHDFDLIGSYSPTAGMFLMAGLIQNMSAIEKSYLEMSKPWWPVNLAHNMAINGNVYFLSGDCSTNAIWQMHSLTFNKDLLNEKYEQDAEEYFAENPHVKTPATGLEGGATATNMLYEKVYAGKWTIDELIYLASDTYVDARGDGLTVDDTYGLCTSGTASTALYGGCNLRQIEPTTDGSILKISDDWTSTRCVRLAAKLYTLFGTPSFTTSGFGTSTGQNVTFYNGTCFFSLHYLRQAEQVSNNDKVENYGVLPTPKYDLNQKNYYTVIGNEFSVYTIFIDFDKRDSEQETLSMLSAVLECWTSEAYRKTTPVIFELSLKLKSSPTQCEADMCEIIRASIEFDLGRVLRAQLSGSVNGAFAMDSQLTAGAAMNGTPWVSQYSQHLTKIQTNLKDFVTKLKKTMVEVK